MGCSVSPCARASAVCMLMQLAQPFRIDERILTSSIRLFSRLFSAARLTALHCFISCGVAAQGSVMLVMSHLLCWVVRSEEHTSALQSLMRISYAVFCLQTHTSM